MKVLLGYLIVGGIAAIVDLLLFAVMFYAADVGWFISGFVSFIFATLLNYRLSLKFVFKSSSRFSYHVEILAVYAASAVGLLINQIILYLYVSSYTMCLICGKVLATGLVFAWNFSIRRNYLFKAPRS